ncbi:hypothetical protein DFH09DRAFT_1437981 [Mycena vulgaris]|nr:hypothetical protein DFH09DRAFT_1437981 [Mycena vulgaris]
MRHVQSSPMFGPTQYLIFDSSRASHLGIIIKWTPLSSTPSPISPAHGPSTNPNVIAPGTPRSSPRGPLYDDILSTANVRAARNAFCDDPSGRVQVMIKSTLRVEQAFKFFIFLMSPRTSAFTLINALPRGLHANPDHRTPVGPGPLTCYIAGVYHLPPHEPTPYLRVTGIVTEGGDAPNYIQGNPGTDIVLESPTVARHSLYGVQHLTRAARHETPRLLRMKLMLRVAPSISHASPPTQPTWKAPPTK